MTDSIADAFGVTPMIEDKKENKFTKQGNAQSDFDTARENLLKIINNGSSAIESVTMLAEMSQNPRFFECLSAMLSTMTTANKELLALHKQIRDIDKMEQNDGQTIQNNLFVGSSADLLKIIKEQGEKK